MTNSNEARGKHKATDRLVEIYRAADNTQAQLILLKLDGAGLKAQVVGTNIAGWFADVAGWDACPRILVFESDRARAQFIINNAEKSNRSDSR